MAIDLQELLMAQQAATLDSAGKSHVQNMDWHDRISQKKFDELDLLQASAAKELGKAGENPRFQPQTAPAAT